MWRKLPHAATAGRGPTLSLSPAPRKEVQRSAPAGFTCSVCACDVEAIAGDADGKGKEGGRAGEEETKSGMARGRCSFSFNGNFWLQKIQAGMGEKDIVERVTPYERLIVMGMIHGREETKERRQSLSWWGEKRY